MEYNPVHQVAHCTLVLFLTSLEYRSRAPTTTMEAMIKNNLFPAKMPKAAPVLRTYVRCRNLGIKVSDWLRCMVARMAYLVAWSIARTRMAMIYILFIPLLLS
jgi:hypothetical protein